MPRGANPAAGDVSTIEALGTPPEVPQKNAASIVSDARASPKESLFGRTSRGFRECVYPLPNVAVILLRELSIQLGPLRVVAKAYNFRMLTRYARQNEPIRKSMSTHPPAERSTFSGR
jgi:hypothetical protein